MSQSTTNPVRWTTADLDLFPDNGNRYEIVEGALLATRAPDWRHQKASTRISTALDTWSLSTGLGEAVQAPGIIFTDVDAVIPDVVWVSRDRLAVLLDAAGHLTGAPEWQKQQVEVYRREQMRLRLVNTLFSTDQLTSPLLPGFSYCVAQLFQSI